MQAGKKHVRAVIKNGLCAVAVVVVHVQNCHALQDAVAQVLRGQGGVVQKAVATKKVGASVVAGRAAQGEGGARALRHVVRRAQGAFRPSACRHPGAGGEGRTSVKRIQTHARGKVIRFHIRAKAARRPHAGQRVVRGVCRVNCNPLIPCRF